MARVCEVAGGWFEDSRGFVRGRSLRKRYHGAGKASARAERAVALCKNDDAMEGLKTEADRCLEDLRAVEAEVKAETFS